MMLFLKLYGKIIVRYPYNEIKGLKDDFKGSIPFLGTKSIRLGAGKRWIVQLP